MVNKNRQKVILTGRPIFQGEGVTAHLGHQAFCLPVPLHDVASHVKVKQFKVDRLQIIVVAKKYIYVSQLFISRMPKMRAIIAIGFGSIKSYTNNYSYSVEHCTLLEEFCNKKNEYHFKVRAV